MHSARAQAPEDAGNGVEEERVASRGADGERAVESAEGSMGEPQEGEEGAEAVEEMVSEQDEEARELEVELASEMGSRAMQEPDASRRSATVRGGGGTTRIQPDVGVVFTGGIGWFSADPTIRSWIDPSVDGSSSGSPTEEHGHEPFSDESGLFLQIQELELSFRAAVDPFLRGDVYMAATPEHVEIEEAYVSTLALPLGLKLRAGWFQLPFGRFNTQHYLETSPFVDQPLPNRRFMGPEQLRGIAFECSWLLPLPWYVMLYGVLSTAENEVTFDASGYSGNGIKKFISLFRLEQFHDISDTWSLKWGLSAARGPHGSNTDSWLIGGDIYLKWRDIRSIRYVALQIETMLRDRRAPDQDNLDAGIYSQLDWRMSRNWSMAGRFDWVKGVEISSPGSSMSSSFLSSLGDQWRMSGSLSFFASEFHRWRIQYVYDRMASPSLGSDVNPRSVHEVFIQYQAVMGSHGAHPF